MESLFKSLLLLFLLGLKLSLPILQRSGMVLRKQNHSPKCKTGIKNFPTAETADQQPFTLIENGTSKIISPKSLARKNNENLVVTDWKWKEEAEQITLSDALGRKVMDLKRIKPSSEISINHLPKGVYWAVFQKGKVKTVKKLFHNPSK